MATFCSNVIFVGGAVAELYADDPAATDIRPTLDVYCVVEVKTYGSMHVFENLLRERKFVNDIESGVICRWKYDGETVDVMPDDEDILGFTNEWYRPGFQHRIPIQTSEDITVYILPPLYYIASKIEAIRGRGGDDLRLSHDFEDLIYVLNNNQNILSLFDAEENDDLVAFISAWANEMLLRPNRREEIECMLPYGDWERVDYIIEILNNCRL